MANEITAAVVVVEYSGHDASASIRSWHATYDEALDAEEKVRAEEDPDGEFMNVMAVTFSDTPLVLSPEMFGS